MIWILLVVAVIVLLIIISKLGNNKFWQLAQKHPEKAYELFSDSDCWCIVYPHQNKTKPSGNWDGPFYFFVKNTKLTIYGKVGEYEKQQNEFINQLKK
ncbi:MAG: hypothetical protein LBN27_01925 [Prevotellaceae bacterium]|jgi:hypothetical protein|nr:hypothetical protein [Prevotellaceae bacterium]